MEEVIARRRNSLGIGYIAMIVIGVVLGAACVGIGIANDVEGAIYLGIVVGLAFVAVGVWQTVIFYKSPKDIIVYRDGVLYLGNKGTCSPLDVTGCKVIVTRRNGIVDRWGKLEITLADGRRFVLNYVDYVKDAQDRLGMLKAECYDAYMRQQAEAEMAVRAAQPAQVSGEDPFGV